MIAPKWRTAQDALELVGKRWNGAILAMLLEGSEAGCRFNQMLNTIPGISDRILTERLRELVDVGLALREVEDGPPVKVRYRITGRGAALRPVFEAVERWAS